MTIEREPVPGSGYIPMSVKPANFRRAGEALLSELRAMRSVTPAVSDALDQLGWRLVVPCSALPRRVGAGTVVGHAVTVQYLHERSSVHVLEGLQRPSRLAHRRLFSTAVPGDVAVFDARGEAEVSVMGGLAAEEAITKGLSGVVIDGAMRDLAEVRDANLSVWARGVTPITGKWRLEAVTINQTISCGAVQVQPGDLVVADDSGICFVPPEALDDVVEVVRDIVGHEQRARAITAT